MSRHYWFHFQIRHTLSTQAVDSVVREIWSNTGSYLFLKFSISLFLAVMFLHWHSK